MKARTLFWTAGGFLAVGVIRYLTNDGGEWVAAGLSLLFIVFGFRARAAELQPRTVVTAKVPIDIVGA